MALYEKVHETWEDTPNETTPIMAEDLEHIEQGIYNNSENIENIVANSITADDFPSYDDVMGWLNEDDESIEGEGNEQ